MRAAVLVPAYEAEPMVGKVVAELLARWTTPDAIFVIDDGCSDATAKRAADAGAMVINHTHNRGKGAALRTGMQAALERGFDVAVTVDADGQHPVASALELHAGCEDPNALVLGVRDLHGAGAPRSSQRSNRFSNLVLSLFTGQRLADTQCGLRRYPIAATLALKGRAVGYGYEAEVIIRAIAANMRIAEVPVDVIYPPEAERLSHFDVVRDPTRIVARVVATVASTRAQWLANQLDRLRATQ